MVSLERQPRTASQLRSLLAAGFLAICILPHLSTALNSSDTGYLAKPKIYHSPPRAVWPSKGDSQPKGDTKCGADRVPHPDTGKCLRKVFYHEKCTHTIQCVTKRAICSGTGRKPGICRCPKYWTLSENRIVCLRRSECTSGPERPGCLASNQFCEVKSNRCRCNSGFTLDEWGHCYLSGEKPQIDPSNGEDDEGDEPKLVTITNSLNSTTQLENVTQKSVQNVTESSFSLAIDRNSPPGQTRDSSVQNVALAMCIVFLILFLAIVFICTLKKDASLMEFHYRKVAAGDPPPRETAQETETTHFMANQ